MDCINYIKIDSFSLIKNIENIKKIHKYKYYILDVSNNAFSHGIYLVQQVSNLIDYFYVHNFNDLILLRKYNQNIPVIYNGEFKEDYIYDLIVNNAILVINDIKTLKFIQSINDNLNIILHIDVLGLTGINKKDDILDLIESENKNWQLVGIMASFDEKHYDDFKYIIRPIKNVSLMLLNNENDKNKIILSNSILLDYSVYGIFKDKKTFKKNALHLEQVFTLYSKVIKINKIIVHKKDKLIGIIPLGYKHGIGDWLKKVWIQNKLYDIFKIEEEYLFVYLDNEALLNHKVEILSKNNPLNNYLTVNNLNILSQFNTNIPIIYDDYTLEKTFIY